MAAKPHSSKGSPGRLKLRIELVPNRLWEQNLRSALGKGRWDKLRRKVIEANGPHCAICGETQRLHGHEVWAYQETKTIVAARLMRVDIVCIDCHDVHHWGRTTELSKDRTISRERYLFLRKHFRRVNGCRQQVLDDHFSQCKRIWGRRSKKECRVDWGDFKPLVEEAEAAREQWGARNAGRAWQDYSPDLGPGHHMPRRCPQCGATGTLRLIETDTEGMSEGQEADYEQGVSGFAFCRECKSTVLWGA
jgi:hypothetical protein